MARCRVSCSIAISQGGKVILYIASLEVGNLLITASGSFFEGRETTKHHVTLEGNERRVVRRKTLLDWTKFLEDAYSGLSRLFDPINQNPNRGTEAEMSRPARCEVMQYQ